MGKGGGSTSSSTTTSGPPQAFLDAYQNVFNRAQGVANQPLQQYPLHQNAENVVYPLTPYQNQAAIQIAETQDQYVPYLNAAADHMRSAATPVSPLQFQGVENLPQQGLAGFTNAANTAANLPGTVAPYLDTARAGDPAHFGANVQNYFNPYQQNVVDTTRDLFNQQNAEQFNQIKGNAAAQGAFGGDREAIAESVAGRQQQLAQNPVLAQLESQGYSQAAQELAQQQQLGLAGGQLAEGANLAGGQLGLSAGQGLLGEFNTQQQTGVGAQEATDWLNQAAGYGMANLGQENQNLRLAQASAKLQAGAMQQQYGQQVLNVPYEQFIQQQAYPFQTTGWLANIAEGLGGASGGRSTTTYPGPSTLGQIGGLGLAGVGLAGQLGAFSGFGGGGGGFSGDGMDFGGGGTGDFLTGTDFGGGGLGNFVTGADGGRVTGAADGGRMEPPRYAGGGGLSMVPGEFQGNMAPSGVPNLADSIVPGAGAGGLGAAPASSGGGGLAQSFRQPVTNTTQTQSSGGGGGILGLLGPALSIGKFFLGADGGRIPRGTYDDGGRVSNNGTPMRLITLAVPDLSKSYVPATQAPARTMGPPQPPAAPPQGQGVGNPLSDALSTLKSSQGLSKLFNSGSGDGGGTVSSESLGGAVEPSPIPLQFDYGGMVPMQATPSLPGTSGPTQQRAMQQQYANLSAEKLQELAMRYPATTPQGAAIARALQIRRQNPTGGYPGGPSPNGPLGASGEATPGTTAARGGRMGLADGGYPPSMLGLADAGVPYDLAKLMGSEPSYAEGQVIPRPSYGAQEAFDNERGASIERDLGAGRDDGLARAMRASRNRPANYSVGLADGGEPVEYIEPPAGALQPDPPFAPPPRPIEAAPSPPIGLGDEAGEWSRRPGGRMMQNGQPAIPPGYRPPSPGGVPASEAAPHPAPFEGSHALNVPGASDDAVFGRGLGAPMGARATTRAPAAPPPLSDHAIAPQIRPEGAPADTIASSGGRLSWGEIAGLARKAGFPEDKVPTITAIAMGESGGNPGAYNGRGENSYGLTQINADAHGPIAKEALNPQRALDLAFNISKGGEDFSPWSVYKSGAYKAYLDPQGTPDRMADARGLGAPPDQVIPSGQGLAARPPVRTVADTASPGSGLSPAIDKILKDIESRQDRGSSIYSSPYLPLIAAGLGMLASRSPFPGVALGEGGLQGLKMLENQQSQLPKNELEQAKADLARLDLGLRPVQMQANADSVAAFTKAAAGAAPPGGGMPAVESPALPSAGSAAGPATSATSASAAPTTPTIGGTAQIPAIGAAAFAPAASAMSATESLRASGASPAQIAQAASTAVAQLPQPPANAAQNDPVEREMRGQMAATVRAMNSGALLTTPDKLLAQMEQYQRLYLSLPSVKAAQVRAEAEAKVGPAVVQKGAEALAELPAKQQFAEFETGQHIARAGGEEAARLPARKEFAEFETGQQIARGAAQTNFEPQEYEVALPGGAGSMTLVAPRSQVLAGTAPGIQQPLTFAATAPQGSPATAGGKFDPDPESLIAVAPPPGVTAKKIELSEAAKGKLQEDHKTLEHYRATAQETPLQLVRIDQLGKLLDQTATGRIAEAGQGLLQWTRAAENAGWLPKGMIPTSYDPTKLEEINKLATQLVFAQIKQIGGRVLVSEIDGLSRANPNVALTPEANKAILQNVALEQQLAKDRYSNASAVFSRYKQLGNFDAKFIDNSPAGQIEERVRQQLGPAQQAASQAAAPPPDRAYSDARAWVKLHPEMRPQVEERLKGWGLDPGRI